MTNAAEKRCGNRFEVEFPAVCTRFHSDTRYPVTVKNFSEDGVYFEAAERFGPGTYLTIRRNGALKASGHPAGHHVKSHVVGQVRWIREIVDGTGCHFGIGVRFLHPFW